MPLTDGFLVEVVEPGSPSEPAGIRGGHLDVVIGGDALLLGGDIITQVNGRQVDTLERLVKAMQGLKVGDTVRLTLFREGQTQDVEFVLPERPLLPQDIPAQRSLTPAARKNFIRCGPQYLYYPARLGPPTPFLDWYFVRDSAQANSRSPRIEIGWSPYLYKQLT